MSIDPGVDAFLSAPINRTSTPAEPAERTEHNLAVGTEVPLIQPGSDEWYQTISASKIAAIVGLSPYDSPMSLWAKMTGKAAREAQTSAMMRGHYLEPAVAAWFRDQHPDWIIRPSGSWVAAGNERHTATPDRHVHKPDLEVDDLLQIKSTTKSYEWGQPGTDEVPDYYRVQVLWEQYVRGASRCHVAVIGPFLDFAEYIVDYDPAEVARLVEAADAFLALVDAGTPPSIDSHGATYETLRELHPDVDPDEKVDIDVDLARRYVHAITAAKQASEGETGAKSALMDAMGTAKKATVDGKPLAGVQQRGQGKPFLVAAKNLPTFKNSVAAPSAEAPQSPAEASNGKEAGPVAAQPDGDAPQSVGERADTSPASELSDRLAWVKDRIVAVRASSDPRAVEALMRFWPEGIAKKASQWDSADIDALHAVLTQVETIDDIGFPEPDPTKPTPSEQAANQRAAKTAEAEAERAANPTLWPINDDGRKPGAHQDAELRGLAALMTAEQKTTVQGLEAAGKRSGRNWHYNAEASRRIAAINTAAIHAAMHLIGPDGDDEALRHALATVLGVELQTAWATGALLGSLNASQADELTSLALRFSAGDEEVTAAIGDHLTRHYAAMAQ